MPSSFLKEKFFKSLDLNYLMSFKHTKKNDRISWVSSGGNFDCYKVDLPGKLSLAFKISQVSCFKKKSYNAWQVWAKDCDRLSASDIELCPPMVTIVDEISVVQILPFGKDLVGYTPGQIKELQVEASKTLASVGFTLGDIPQFKSIDGKVLLVDFSELQKL